MSSLSAADQKILMRALGIGQALEQAWPKPTEDLRLAIAECERAEAADLQRLAKYADQLRDDMPLNHLSAVMIAFERLAGRALADNEFLIVEGDREAKLDRVPHQRRLVLIADNIRSAFNVGALVRTSECFGIEALVLSGYTPTPDHPAVSKTAMGTDDHLKWSHASRLSDAVAPLKSQGYTIIALETAQTAVPLDQFRWPEKAALIVGNERFGLDPAQLRLCDQIVRLPLYGAKNSLNVGISAGIALHHWASQTTARQYQPVGVFRTNLGRTIDAPRQGTVAGGPRSEGYIEFFPDRGFEQALEDLTGIDRIWILSELNLTQNWKPKVRPPRGSTKKRGVFATRSPHRPNPIGLTCARLKKVDRLRVYLGEFDLIDGTPILDIKPYLPYADSFPESATGWIEGAEQQTSTFDVVFSELAERQLHWLTEHGLPQLGDTLRTQLGCDPHDYCRKRVWLLDDPKWCFAYRTWRVIYETRADGSAEVMVHSICTGYSTAELGDENDLYADKVTHKAFIETFGSAASRP